jgi:hypothetical protein
MTKTAQLKYSKIHEVKIEPRFLDRINSGQKRFEIRNDDRDYQVGDWMRLTSCDGEFLAVKIIYKSTFMQREGYCVLGFTVGEENE